MKEGRTWTDQELDARFQEAAAAQAAPAFQEEFWTEMEAMLPTKKNKKAIFWWGGSAAVVVLVAGSFFFLMNGNTAKVELDQMTADLAGQTEKNISKQEKTLQKTINTDIQDEKKLEWVFDPSKMQFPFNFSGQNWMYQPTCGGVIYSDAWPYNSMIDGSAVGFPYSTDNSDAVLASKEIRFTETKTLSASDRSRYKKQSPFYVDFGVGFGQSYKRVNYASNWMQQFRVGFGVYQEIGNMELGAGLALRAELPNNISGSVNNGVQGTDIIETTDFKGLYSLEFPLTISGKIGRSTIGGIMNPGIQMGYSGVRTVYVNSQVESRDQVVETVPNAKTLTMEMGVRYAYSLNENVQFTSMITADLVRPFQSAYYQGETKDFPVTFFVGLRRTF